jgi:hypothetical protein
VLNLDGLSEQNREQSSDRNKACTPYRSGYLLVVIVLFAEIKDLAFFSRPSATMLPIVTMGSMLKGIHSAIIARVVVVVFSYPREVELLKYNKSRERRAYPSLKA